MHTRPARRGLRAAVPAILAVLLFAPLAHAQIGRSSPPSSAPADASAASTASAPTPARTIAVISLVGDKIDVVTAVTQTGRLMDANGHNVLPFAAAGLDISALGAAQTVLRKVDPTLDIALLAASRLETFEAQDKIFDGDHVKLPEEVAAAVQREHATQLVLMTKYRSEARLTGGNGALGNGKIGGLGFYVDFAARIKSSETGGIERGFIAPFAYIQLSLIDVATNTVVRRTEATHSYLLGTAGHPAETNPWEVLTPDQKVAALKEVLGGAVRDALPKLMATPSAK